MGFGKLNGMRDLTATLYPGSGILHNFGTGCGNGKADDIRDSDDRGSGCGIPRPRSGPYFICCL